MKVTITIEIDLATYPPSSSELDEDEAPKPVQTSLEDFSQSEDFDERTICKGNYHHVNTQRDHNHMRRKFIYKCSICGKVGYNARSHPDHFSEV